MIFLKELIQQLHSKLKELKLDPIDGFLPDITVYLSEPKSQAVFKASKLLNHSQFNKKLELYKLTPHPQNRILSPNNQVYCNGESITKGQNLATARAWQKISVHKVIHGKMQVLDNSSFYEDYQAGWVIFQ